MPPLMAGTMQKNLLVPAIFFAEMSGFGKNLPYIRDRKSKYKSANQKSRPLKFKEVMKKGGKPKQAAVSCKAT